ncbi:Highly reducing polyketide synthase SAT13, partial [Frankliniella fusca]
GSTTRGFEPNRGVWSTRRTAGVRRVKFGWRTVGVRVLKPGVLRNTSGVHRRTHLILPGERSEYTEYIRSMVRE